MIRADIAKRSPAAVRRASISPRAYAINTKQLIQVVASPRGVIPKKLKLKAQCCLKRGSEVTLTKKLRGHERDKRDCIPLRLYLRNFPLLFLASSFPSFILCWLAVRDIDYWS